jgi:hypothetical protein
MTDPTSGPADATPLTEDERQGLTLPVLTRAEVNRAEAEIISLAMSWLFFSQRRLQPRPGRRKAPGVKAPHLDRWRVSTGDTATTPGE